MDTWLTTRIVITSWRANYTPLVIPTPLHTVCLTGSVSSPQTRSNNILQLFVSRIGIGLFGHLHKKQVKRYYVINATNLIHTRFTFTYTLLTLSRQMSYIYMSYRTANLQTLHFKYFFNKYPF
jgi:hypothetical protein